MKDIYQKMWELAKPYYEKGRPMDIDHIKWMMKEALFVCEKESLDDSLLLPLVILHDVGYAEVSKGNPFNLDRRKAHMKSGKEIARKILEKLDYPKDKTENIVYYVSVHDNWAFGDNEIYLKEKILWVFTDLDFMWMVTPKGFPALMKILNKNGRQMIEYLKSRETPLRGISFSTKTTKKLYENYFKERKKEVESKTIP